MLDSVECEMQRVQSDFIADPSASGAALLAWSASGRAPRLRRFVVIKLQYSTQLTVNDGTILCFYFLLVFETVIQ